MPKAPKARVGQNKKVVHPNSRKAQYLARQACRDSRIGKVKSARSKIDALGEKLSWFRENLDDEKSLYTKEELYELTKCYFQRFQEELEQIDIVSSVGVRKGQQHAPRAAAIKLTMDSEKNEFDNAGIEVPDLVNKKTFTEFKDWNGELRFIQNFKLRKIRKTDFEDTEDDGKHEEIESN